MEKEYYAEYRKDLYKSKRVFTKTPGINAPQLKQNISIQS